MSRRCGFGVQPHLAGADQLAIEAFGNFLAWGVRPDRGARPVPPAWFAYALGASAWCPPPGVC